MKKIALLLISVTFAGVLLLMNYRVMENESAPDALEDMFSGVLDEENLQLLSSEVAASRDPAVFQRYVVDGISADALMEAAVVPHYRPDEAEYTASVEEYIESYQDTFSGIADMLSAAQSDEAILFVDIPEPDDATFVLYDKLNSAMFFLYCTY